MNPGETILGFDLGDHLWVVLSGPNQAGEIAMVNFTEHRGVQCGQAPCTVVDIGEHPYLVKQSCIYFRGALLNPLAPLERAKNAGTLRQHAPLAAALLRRIQAAVIAHRMVDRVVKLAVQESP